VKTSLYPRVDPGKLGNHRFGDYAMRFLFGAGISLVAGLAAMAFGPKIGGVLLGFPAILPASLTLIQKKEGKEEAAVDSIGAILGAIAMIAFAVVVSISVVRLGVVSSLLIALLVWAAVAVALYFLVALTFEREPAPP
jgi:Protein of unknown function (DUF3147)